MESSQACDVTASRRTFLHAAVAAGLAPASMAGSRAKPRFSRAACEWRGNWDIPAMLANPTQANVGVVELKKLIRYGNRREEKYPHGVDLELFGKAQHGGPGRHRRAVRSHPPAPVSNHAPAQPATVQLPLPGSDRLAGEDRLVRLDVSGIQRQGAGPSVGAGRTTGPPGTDGGEFVEAPGGVRREKCGVSGNRRKRSLLRQGS